MYQKGNNIIKYIKDIKEKIFSENPVTNNVKETCSIDT